MTDAIANVELKEVAIDATNPIIEMIERAARDPNVDADKLEKMLELANKQRDREREIAREDDGLRAKRVFMSCFTRAKAEMPQVVKDARNNQTSSDYATMESIDAAITPIMTKYGFHLSFMEGDSARDENHMHIIALLGHEDGHERKYPVQVPVAGVGMKGNRMMTSTHGYGATKTYGRRYAKLDIWDITVMDKDSDGNVNNGLDTESEAGWRKMLAACEKTKAAHMALRADIVKDITLSGPERSNVEAMVLKSFQGLPESERNS